MCWVPAIQQEHSKKQESFLCHPGMHNKWGGESRTPPCLHRRHWDLGNLPENTVPAGITPDAGTAMPPIWTAPAGRIGGERAAAAPIAAAPPIGTACADCATTSGVLGYGEGDCFCGGKLAGDIADAGLTREGPSCAALAWLDLDPAMLGARTTDDAGMAPFKPSPPVGPYAGESLWWTSGPLDLGAAASTEAGTDVGWVPSVGTLAVTGKSAVLRAAPFVDAGPEVILCAAPSISCSWNFAVADLLAALGRRLFVAASITEVTCGKWNSVRVMGATEVTAEFPLALAGPEFMAHVTIVALGVTLAMLTALAAWNTHFKKTTKACTPDRCVSINTSHHIHGHSYYIECSTGHIFCGHAVSTQLIDRARCTHCTKKTSTCMENNERAKMKPGIGMITRQEGNQHRVAGRSIVGVPLLRKIKQHEQQLVHIQAVLTTFVTSRRSASACRVRESAMHTRYTRIKPDTSTRYSQANPEGEKELSTGSHTT